MSFIKSWIYAITHTLWGKPDANIELELLKLQIKRDVDQVDQIITDYKQHHGSNVKSIKGKWHNDKFGV